MWRGHSHFSASGWAGSQAQYFASQLVFSQREMRRRPTQQLMATEYDRSSQYEKNAMLRMA
jgi:hypothetical protein